MTAETSDLELVIADMQKSQVRSDAQLLQLALAGEESAFLELYERLKGGVFRYAFYMTGSQSAAEEVTQEVFLSLLREGSRYRAELGDVGAFVFGIARNLVRRVERRERGHKRNAGSDALEKLSAELASETETLPGQLLRGEVVQKVQVAIASLPDHYRQVVVLCDLCEFSYIEAAARLGCAVGTVRSRLNRGHTLLAQKLRPLKKTSAIPTAGTEGWAL